MIKAGIDQDALITMFAEASTKQGKGLEIDPDQLFPDTDRANNVWVGHGP